MSKKFLFLMILGLCCQGIDLASAKVVPQCDTLISKCESVWETAVKKNDPSILCGSVLTTQQTKQWPGILELCKTDAKEVLTNAPEKRGSCHALVYMLQNDVAYAPKYKGKGEYCKK